MKILKKMLSLFLTAAIMVGVMCTGAVSAAAEEYLPSNYTITGKYTDDYYVITLGGIGGEEMMEELLQYVSGYTCTMQLLFATNDGIYNLYVTQSINNGNKIGLWLDRWDSNSGTTVGKYEQIKNISIYMDSASDASENYMEYTFKIGAKGDGIKFADAIKDCPSVFVMRGWLENGYNMLFRASPSKQDVKPDFNFTQTTTSSSSKNISSLSFSKISNKAYTGKAIKPSVTVKDGDTKLKKGTDYTVSYKNNKNIGTASVTIKGKGDYTGSKTIDFKIVPAKTTLKASKQSDTKVKLTWDKVKNAEKYQIYYSTNGGKYKKLATVSGSKTSYTNSKLDFKKNDYKFKIRAYDKVDGTTYYGSFSKAVTVK